MAELNGMQGNEIADDFIRKSVPQGRWRDTWDVFKSNFFKLVLLNIFTLITFAPGVAIVYIRANYISNMGLIYPFNSSVLYPYYTNVQGLAERVTLSADILFYSLLIVAGLIASLGVSGSAYCIRKLLLTHGEFKVKNFFHGIKVGYFNTVLPVTVFILFVFGAMLIGDWKDYVLAVGGNAPGAITAYVFMIIATVLAGIYLAWVFSVGVSFRVKFKYLLRNSFVLLIGTPIQTIIIAGFALIPVWLMFGGGFWLIIAYIIFIFFGFSFILLTWLSFSQWAFDLFISPNLKAEKEAAKAQKSEKELAAEKAEEDRRIARELLAAGKSELIARPIMPIGGEKISCLGYTFTRADISAAADSREKLGESVKEYEKAHSGDAVYVEYNKMFAEREKALEAPKDKKAKNKKISSDNLLK